MTRKLVHMLVLAGMVTFVLWMAFPQEAFAEGEGGGPGKSWFELFKTTGMVGILLLLCSIIGTALLLQYIITINEQNLMNPQLLGDMENLLGEGNIDDAYALVEADNTYAGKVFAAALSHSAGGFEEARKSMEEAAAIESFHLNAKLSYLSLIGNIGPLLGLLGTVTGMISSFQVIETLKAPTPGDLAKGVYESLVNTTIGLFIAIVFLSAYFFMKNKVSDLTLRINNQIGEVLLRGLGGEGAAKESK
jgi:biopolymer transport protein ExbB